MSLPWDKKFPVVGKITVFHFFTGSGRLALCRAFGFGGDFHSLLGGFLFVFRSRFMGCLCENPQKNPWIGAVLEEVLRRWGLEAHHLGHRLEIWIEIGMEGGVVVVDGAIRVFQAISRKDAHHGCSGRNLIFPLE